jgi:hypothetical protein
MAFLRRFFFQICLLYYPGFTSLDFATVSFLQSKVVSLASNPQLGESGLCIYVAPVTGWSSYTPSHWIPFWKPSTLTGLLWKYSNPSPH